MRQGVAKKQAKAAFSNRLMARSGITLVLLALAFMALLGTASHAFWRQADDNTIALADLPRQGRLTYALILEGGPFPYEKDGTVFGNRERLLPTARRGYYREYTVATPGARNRGARRIVCGGRQPTQPDACWYTQDHYASFRQIVP